ncbi:Cell division control protein 11 [Mucor velutinosus]|uniref:Cell division control protein 11 n=1 Tax=Mucor velutinosus TaxID=708070 RepID=A0AAN7DJE7_9FUNG|nr:Cell division control protein 11 [Mucor velutinosus]
MTEEAYNCESRPLMTVLLIVSILILLFLRKSSLVKNWVSSHQDKLSQDNQADEEEGLMQRVV